VDGHVKLLQAVLTRQVNAKKFVKMDATLDSMPVIQVNLMDMDAINIA
jgi:hypothetical protein